MVKETFKFSIRKLIQNKINGGIILLFVALAAMIIANSPGRVKNAFAPVHKVHKVMPSASKVHKVHGILCLTGLKSRSAA